MTSLDFLYIALGGGFVLLVIFLCVMLLHLTLVLRDATKITENMRAVSDKVRETVFEPLKALSEMSAGFTFIHEIIEKLRARFHHQDNESADEDQDGQENKSAENTESSENESGFSVKKLRK